MYIKPQPFYRLKLTFVYLFVKLKFLRFLLPSEFRNNLPIGWNNHMFWISFKSGGRKSFYDYYCKLKKPSSYVPKAIVDQKYKLKEEDVRHFYENGYTKPFRVISKEKANEVSKHLLNMATKTKSEIHDYNKFEFVSGKNNQEFEFPKDLKDYIKSEINMNNRHLEDPVLLNIFKHPEITERCAQLIGENILLWRSHFFSVPPKTKGTYWHQGSSWLTNSMRDSILKPSTHKTLFQVTAWVALTDTTKEKACLKILSDSQWEIYPISLNFDMKGRKPSVIFGKYDGKVDHEIVPEDINYIEMKAGECIIFSERALHGSTDNDTDLWRWGVNARYVKTDTRVYSDKMLKEGDGSKMYNLKNINLDKWKAVLVRGEDHYGLNRLLKEEDMPVYETESLPEQH